MRTDHWSFAGHSERGANHRRGGITNQDAIASHRSEGRYGIVAAISDGHGAPQHYLSHVGAQFAVASAIEVLREDRLRADTELRSEVIARWSSAVDAHWDMSRSLDDRRASPTSRVAYGATLLGVGIGEDHVRLFHIGDGAIRVGYPDGAIVSPASLETPGTRSVGSLCALDAATRLCCTRLKMADRPDFVLLASDGFTDSLGGAEEIDAAARRLREFAMAKPEKLNEGIFRALRDMREWGCGDDATLWIAVRSASRSCPNQRATVAVE